MFTLRFDFWTCVDQTSTLKLHVNRYYNKMRCVYGGCIFVSLAFHILDIWFEGIFCFNFNIPYIGV